MNIHKFIQKIIQTQHIYAHGIETLPHGTIYSCINPYSYHFMRQFPSTYYGLDGIFVDGITMCWWIRLLWGEKINRNSFDMTGIARTLFSSLNKIENKNTIFFLGAHQEEIENSIQNIKSEYKYLNIIGYRNGYFEDSVQRYETIENIIKLNPSYVIVGMGSPLQENFAIELKNSGYNGIIFTCGGFLHQTKEKLIYYPTWINLLNLRAFYRLYKERNLLPRLYNVLIEFPVLFIYDTFKTKISRK